MNFSVVSNSEYGESDIKEGILEILEMNKLLSMSTVDSRGNSHINTAFYVFNNSLSLFFMSEPKTRHCQNIETKTEVAVNIFDSRQRIGSKLRGIQFHGNCQKCDLTEMTRAFLLFSKRFPELLDWAKTIEEFLKHLDSRFYKINLLGGNLFHELKFGEETYIPFSIK